MQAEQSIQDWGYSNFLTKWPRKVLQLLVV